MSLDGNVISNIIAFISAGISGVIAYFYFRDRKHMKYQISSSYASQIMAWYSETIEVLMLLKYKTINESADDANFETNLAKLSALIEKGRFFFPNVNKTDGYGNHKPTAYRGYRNLALDFLVAAFNLFNDATTRKKNIDQASLLIQHFTSIVFEIIHPQENLLKLKALTDRYFVREKIFEDFLVNKDPSVLEFIWMQKTKDSEHARKITNNFKE